MKMNRIVSLLLAIVMLFSTIGAAFAAEVETAVPSSTAVTTKSASGEKIVADWLWASVSDSRGHATLMKEYANAGVTDLYVLVKGTGGKVAWNSSVAGTTAAYSYDVLQAIIDAAKPYGIRIHAWMMAGHDSHYIANVDSGAIAYHFRYGYSDTVTQRINLRDEGYMAYMKALVEELCTNYDIAGIHLDTMRYGGIYYDWGKNARDELLTNYGITIDQYNAATKAMCVSAGYKYTTATASTPGYNNGATYTYYKFSSAGTTSGNSLSTVLSSSSYGDAYKGAQAFLKLRTDSVTNFVKMVREAAGDKTVSVAIMPEPIGSVYNQFVYGQDPSQLASCTDYITPMVYSTVYTTNHQGSYDKTWVATKAKALAATGCNVVAGIQTFPESGYSSSADNQNAELPLLMEAAQTVNTGTGGKILGYAFFRACYMTIGNATYDADSSSIKMYVANQKLSTSDLTTPADIKLVYKMQNGMTATSVSNLSGFTSGTTATISSDGKTITLYNSGKTVLASASSATFNVKVTGTPSATYGAAQLYAYTSSGLYNSYCNTTISGEATETPTSTTAATTPAETTPAVSENPILLDFNSGDVASTTASWTANHSTVTVDNTDGVASGTISGNDPYIAMASTDSNLKHKIVAGDVVQVRLKVNLTSGTAGDTQVFFTTDSSTSYSATNSLRGKKLDCTSGLYQTLTMVVPDDASYIGQTITKLRLDMVNSASGDLVGDYVVDYIYFGDAEHAPNRANCTSTTHTRIETWSNGNGTHNTFCYDCQNSLTENCIVEAVDHKDATANEAGYTVYACVGGASGKDAFSTTGGCGYTYTETIPATGVEAPSAEYLLFDFDNSADAQARYNNTAYGYTNFDTGNWSYTNRLNAPVYDNANGTMSYELNTGSSFWFQSSADSQKNYVMNFDPSKAEYVQIRLKLENFVADGTPNMRLVYYYTPDKTTDATIKADMFEYATDIYTIDTSSLSSGKYITITMPLNDAFKQREKITAIRASFGGMTSSSDAMGKVTVDYIYVGAEENIPQRDYLLFDFDNSADAQARYNNTAYGFTNFDIGSWSYANRLNAPVYDNANGTMSYELNTGSSFWFQSSADSQKNYVMNFDPSKAEYVQIRLKLENFVADGTPNMRLVYYYTPDKTTDATIKADMFEYATDIYTFDTSSLTSGKYITITMPLNDAFKQQEKITAIRASFGGMTSSSDAMGKVTVDYIYVGAEESLPATDHLFFDFTNTAKDVIRYNTKQYGYVQFDDAANKGWSASAHTSNVSFDHSGEGTMTISRGASSSVTNYLQIETVNKAANTVAPLSYAPSAGDCIQIRVKFENVTAAANPCIQLYYSDTASTAAYVNGGNNKWLIIPLDADKMNSGEYQTVSAYATDDMTASELIYALRTHFTGITVDATSKIIIDYIYVGAASGLPEALPAEPDPTDPAPTDPEPSDPIEAKNGIISENGGLYYYVDGEIGYNAGLIKLDGSYYYVRSSGQCAVGQYWVTNTNGLMEEGFYTFGTDGKMIISTDIKNGIISENGGLYYYVNGNLQYNAGLIQLDGSYYYVRSSGQCAVGQYWVTNTNGLMEEGFYTFGTDGKMVLSTKNGIVSENGGLYYYVNGNLQYNAGLVKLDGSYYYVRSSGQCAVGQYWVTNTNGLMEEGFYHFGTDGKMIISTDTKNGIVSENGGLYYYVNGNLQYNAGLIQLDGDYYYVRSNGQCAVGKYWVTKTNDLMEEGFYFFGADGKMTEDTTVPEETEPETTAPEETEPETTAPEETEPETTAPEATIDPNDMYAQVIAAAAEVVNYIDNRKAVPSSVTVGSTSYTLASYEYLAAQAIVGINNGTTSGSLTVRSINEASNPSETVTAGTIALANYVDMATRTVNWDVNNGTAANYTTTTLGQMHYYERVYFFSSILAAYGEDGELPATATVYTWATLSTVPSAPIEVVNPTIPTGEETVITLSDSGITTSGAQRTVTTSNDIIYYENRTTYDSGNTYGAGSTSDMHTAAEAAAHTVVNITEPGIYRITGKMSKGQIRVDLGDDAFTDPTAVVTLILDNVDLTCEVAPAILFMNVYECDNDWESTTASASQDTSAAGANLVLADGTTNTVNGSYVAKIYKDNGNMKKLWKQDGAIYSYMSMNVFGDGEGTGVLDLNAEFEGLDTELHLTIVSGNINIRAQDDGINTNEDGVSVTTINGGCVHIIAGLGAEGDGIDSNGYLVINGGVVVSSANPGADAGLDSDLGSFINGGTVIALGSTMDWAESDSNQVTMNLQFSARRSSGDAIVVKNSAGQVIFAYDPDDDEILGSNVRQYQGAVISCSAFEVGATYSIYIGGTLSGTETGGVYETVTTYSGGTQQAYSGTDVSTGGPGAPGGRPGSGSSGTATNTAFYMQDKVNFFSGVANAG